jgi:hypothetical protein
MTPAELLAEMSRSGCCLGVEGISPMPVAAAWIDGMVLRWIQMPPEDQHHAHVANFRKAEIVNKRDVRVHLVDGSTIYFAPAAEWPEINYAEWRQAWGEWQSMLADSANAERFAEFCEDTVGQRPPTS